MDNKEIVKQMINFHKTSFGNCFSTMVTLQDQVEKIMKTFVDNTPGINDEGKKVMDQLHSVYKKNRTDFKKAVDEGYEKVEAFFDGNAVAMFQDQTKKMFDLLSNQKSFTPHVYMKDMMTEWVSMFNENMKNVGDRFSVANKQQTKTEQKK